MKKILLNKKIEIDEVISKIETELENDITLIIPKNSNFSEEDFLALKKANQFLNKNIFIESVDEKILNLAQDNGFESHHPLFDQAEGLLTDIKRPTDVKKLNKEDLDIEYKHKINLEREKENKEVNFKFIDNDFRKENEFLKEENLNLEKKQRFFQDFKDDEIHAQGKHHYKKHKKIKFNFKFLGYGLLILVLGFGFWKLSYVFSSAEINLKFKKTPFEFNDVITGNKNVSVIDVSKKIIPVEVFKNQQNLTKLFKASGEKQVSEKARGEIIIYNAYSSEPQTLVATTRFEAPNGLIYRLTDKVIIPGAQIKDNKIIPSSIIAIVEADKPGAEYNSDSIKKLTIPGFKGSPKYDGFYGELKSGIKGGFIGKKLIPTNDDVLKAQEEIKQSLKSISESSLLLKKPDDFKFISDFKTNILKISVNTTTDENGNFAVFGEAETKVFGIREKDIYNFLLQFLNQPDKKINDLKVEYLNLNPDFEKGILTFNLKARGNAVYDFNVSDFKNSILGKSIKDVENIIKNLKELESAKILISPRWVGVLPQKVSKININLQ
jgi:hypothetical protein